MAKTKRLAIIGYYNPPRLGVGVYMDGLVPALAADLTARGWQVDLWTSAGAIAERQAVSDHIRRTYVIRALSGKLSRLLYLLCYFPLRARLSGYRAVLFLTNPLLGPGLPVPLAVIHDLNEFEIDNKYGRLDTWLRKHLMLGSAFRHARRLIAISGHVKRQIARHAGARAAARCAVIHNGIGNDPASPADALLSADDLTADTSARYFLIVGRVDPKGKNLRRALQLFRALQAQDPRPLMLYLAGGLNASSRTDGEAFLAELADDPTVRYLGYVSDAGLARLYRHARATIFYSRHEGFGLPLLEAYRHGCPVLVHPDNQAAAEIGGGAQIAIEDSLVDDPPALAARVTAALTGCDPTRLRAIADGYTWPRAAARYADLIEGKELAQPAFYRGGNAAHPVEIEQQS